MSEIHAAVGSYVVNALDGPELDEFEQHLAVCETCRHEVVEFSETAAHLGSLVETPPPPALRGSILSAIREVRPLPPEEHETPGEAPAARRMLVEAEPQTTDDPPVDELAVRRQRRATRLLSLAVAASMVLALALGGWVFNLQQDRAAQVASANLVTELMAAPDAKVVKTTLKNGAPVSFVISKSLDKALLLGNNVPPAGADKTYQLWTVEAGKSAVPNNTFGGGAKTQAWFAGSVKSAASFAVSLEAAGGSTTQPDQVLGTVPL
ncbi:MAG TPA: anti-sigma factor [Propionibacteriaceae bacterium]|jgi:anti-sigma-K factor RskA